jgi:cytidine deaminase
MSEQLPFVLSSHPNSSPPNLKVHYFSDHLEHFLFPHTPPVSFQTVPVDSLNSRENHFLNLLRSVFVTGVSHSSSQVRVAALGYTEGGMYAYGLNHDGSSRVKSCAERVVASQYRNWNSHLAYDSLFGRWFDTENFTAALQGDGTRSKMSFLIICASQIVDTRFVPLSSPILPCHTCIGDLYRFVSPDTRIICASHQSPDNGNLSNNTDEIVYVTTARDVIPLGFINNPEEYNQIQSRTFLRLPPISELKEISHKHYSDWYNEYISRGMNNDRECISEPSFKRIIAQTLWNFRHAQPSPFGTYAVSAVYGSKNPHTATYWTTVESQHSEDLTALQADRRKNSSIGLLNLVVYIAYPDHITGNLMVPTGDFLGRVLDKAEMHGRDVAILLINKVGDIYHPVLIACSDLYPGGEGILKRGSLGQSYCVLNIEELSVIDMPIQEEDDQGRGSI